MLKLYVVVRNDIDVPFQMCQVAHAVADLSVAYPAEFKAWNKGNNTICVLQAPDGHTLAKIAEAAADGGLKHAAFHEPDAASMGIDLHYAPDLWKFGEGPWLTAIAFTPDWFVQHLLLADLPLALDKQTVKDKVGLKSSMEAVERRTLGMLYQEQSDKSQELSRLVHGTRKFRRDYFKANRPKPDYRTSW